MLNQADIRPADGAGSSSDDDHSHNHSHDHSHKHSHDHSHTHSHDHSHPHPKAHDSDAFKRPTPTSASVPTLPPSDGDGGAVYYATRATAEPRAYEPLGEFYCSNICPREFSVFRLIERGQVLLFMFINHYG